MHQEHKTMVKAVGRFMAVCIYFKSCELFPDISEDCSMKTIPAEDVLRLDWNKFQLVQLVSRRGVIDSFTCEVDWKEIYIFTFLTRAGTTSQVRRS